MKVIYPAIFHKDTDGYWVEFPDLPGCFSDGDTTEEALVNASEALLGYCQTMLENKQTLSKPTPIQDIKTDADCFTSFVESELVFKKSSTKKTLTIPTWLNEAAEKRGVNFSAILQKALIKELGIL